MKTKTSSVSIKLDGQTITLETGLFGVQSAGSVTARCGDTIVMASAVTGAPKEGLDFFPLTIEYREKHYAGGIITSNRFIKREGRPSDNEILTSRLIDRSVRPFFPKNLFNEVQIIITPLSIDGVNEPEILGIIAASAAVSISPIPFAGPIGAVRLGLKDGKFITNPTSEQKLTSDLDLVISGTSDSIAMVEAGSKEISEKDILGALKEGQKQLALVTDAITQLVNLVGKPKVDVPEEIIDPAVTALLDSVNAADVIEESKTQSGEGIKLSPIVDALVGENEEIDKMQLARLIDDKLKEEIRRMIVKDSVRYDGRKTDEIRSITASVGLLPRTHGSGFFQRGMTHVLSVVTLASPAHEQLMEGMKGEESKRYMHHYNMTPVATGEPGRFGNPGRREIGHGALAERALLPVLPSQEDFPYTIRVVSEVMSSNGSTSQASVCGSSLSLMDAGVPIKKPVAGIAMGLITTGKDFITLSDIAGLEDHFGDMDFKVAGTKDGITAIQMDVKVLGVNAAILESALEQAKVGRFHILDKMAEAIKEPRADLSPYAPRIVTILIPGEKIGLLIGPGGKTIRELQTKYEVEINVDEDELHGIVNIAGIDPAKVKAAKEYVDGLTAMPEIGKVYDGEVKHLMDFGAFVEILPGQEGLVHVSRMGEGFVKHPSEVVKEGQIVKVKLYEIDSQGRLNLTMKLEDGGTGGGDRGGDRGLRPSTGARPFSPRPSAPASPRSEQPRRDSRPPRSTGPRREDRSFKKFQDFR